MKAEKLSDDIKSGLDIVDVVSDYVELRKAGQNYKGICPFHAEKTPSFMVSPDKQIFHCFGCGVGGNLIHFVMKYENLSFQESLRLLAKKAGIALKEYRFDTAQENEKEKLRAVHGAAADVFADSLRKSRRAHSYLTQRGISDEDLRSFSLGYAPKDWRFVTEHLRRRGFNEKVILQSGLASSGDRGIYDTFRDRIMFPVYDVQGQIIAFGGRVMDDSQPKYLNSPEHPLFKKGETLYGLNAAKEGIRKKGGALITEGYFDVILCHHHGFTNAVAPLGTALTSGHLQKLQRFTKKVVLVFDGDAAGKGAAKRSLPVLLSHGFTVKVLLLPGEHDPDSYLKQHGGPAFGSLLSQAQSVVDFILDVSEKDRTETIHEAIEVISGAADMIMQEELIGELSQKTGRSEAVVRELIRKRVKTDRMRREERTSPTGALSAAFSYDEEVLLLSAVIAYPEKLQAVLDKLGPGDFDNPRVRSILEHLVEAKAGGSIDALVGSLGDDEKGLVTRLTVTPGFDHELVDRSMEDCIKKIMKRKALARVKDVQERIKQAETAGSDEMLRSLLRERQKLMREAG